MKDRYDILGTLPDVIEDDWIDDVEEFDARVREFTERRSRQCIRPPLRVRRGPKGE